MRSRYVLSMTVRSEKVQVSRAVFSEEHNEVLDECGYMYM